jgi:hypothetical protein
MGSILLYRDPNLAASRGSRRHALVGNRAGPKRLGHVGRSDEERQAARRSLVGARAGRVAHPVWLGARTVAAAKVRSATWSSAQQAQDFDFRFLKGGPPRCSDRCGACQGRCHGIHAARPLAPARPAAGWPPRRSLGWVSTRSPSISSSPTSRQSSGVSPRSTGVTISPRSGRGPWTRGSNTRLPATPESASDRWTPRCSSSSARIGRLSGIVAEIAV